MPQAVALHHGAAEQIGMPQQALRFTYITFGEQPANGRGRDMHVGQLVSLHHFDAASLTPAHIIFKNRFSVSEAMVVAHHQEADTAGLQHLTHKLLRTEAGHIAVKSQHVKP